MTILEMQKKLQGNLNQLKEIRGKGESRTSDELATMQTLVTESASLKGEMETAIRIEEEAKAAEIGLNSFLNDPATKFEHSHSGTAGDSESQIGTKRIVIPAHVRKSSVNSLRCFKGERAQEKAYGFGMWCLATIGQNQKAQAFCVEHGLGMYLKAQAENSNVAGGFLVPPQFDDDIIDLREAYGIFRKNAKRSVMTGDTKQVPRRTGGVTAYFTTDGVGVADSTKGWDQVGLTAKKLMTLILYSNELNEDAIIDLGDDLAQEIAYAFALKEDQCGFIGDGSATYSGMVGVANRLYGLSATKTQIAGLVLGSGSGFGGITLTNLLGVLALLPQYADSQNNMSGPGAPVQANAADDVKWYCHRTFYFNVMLSAALAAGGVTEKEVMQSYIRPMFLGYPVQFVQVMPGASASAIVPVTFGNLRLAALFGDRRETTIDMSKDRYFDTDQLAIKGTERFDINVHDVGNASATASLKVPGPMVGLYTG